MPDTAIDQVVSELKRIGADFYPTHEDLKNVRVVGHTPKNDHYIYDVVMDFADGNERLAAKIYRSGKGAKLPSILAAKEQENTQKIYEIFSARNFIGVPRPIGDFSSLGAVVTEKISGLPLQSIIMKAALLPGYADGAGLREAARRTGRWLQNFHRATAGELGPFNAGALLTELAKLCESCRGEGLDDAAIKVILTGTDGLLSHARTTQPTSAVLNDFTPLNVIVTENGIGICDYAKVSFSGNSYHDVAMFMACVEALEKYPFCNRSITSIVQDSFLEAYGASEEDQAILRVLKMKTLLGMFAQGRGLKESAVRKKVMWATVMKRFIQQAAQRSMAPAA